MKKFLFVVASLAMLCSCQKGVMDRPLPAFKGERQILFGVRDLNASVQTKALTANVLANLDGGFKVLGITDSDKASYVNNLTATKISDGLFGVANYYWPTSGTMSFYALYGIDSSLVNNSGAVKFGLCNADAQFDGKKDVIAACALTQGNQMEKVPLAFEHVLNWIASVGFTKDDANATVKVDSVSIKAPGYGTYSFGTDSLVVARDSIGVWSNLPAKDSYKEYVLFDKDAGQEITGTEQATALAAADFKDVMVIAAGASTLTVRYTVTINGATETYTKTADIDLWQGKKATVSAVLTNDLTPIQFLVSVVDWVPENIVATLE